MTGRPCAILTASTARHGRSSTARSAAGGSVRRRWRAATSMVIGCGVGLAACSMGDAAPGASDSRAAATRHRRRPRPATRRPIHRRRRPDRRWPRRLPARRRPPRRRRRRPCHRRSPATGTGLRTTRDAAADAAARGRVDRGVRDGAHAAVRRRHPDEAPRPQRPRARAAADADDARLQRRQLGPRRALRARHRGRLRAVAIATGPAGDRHRVHGGLVRHGDRHRRRWDGTSCRQIRQAGGSSGPRSSRCSRRNASN